MHSAFATLLDKLSHPDMKHENVIPWASPIPAFGDVASAEVATVGLNPSNREFVDEAGVELTFGRRRFHTLSSLDLSDWSEADARHIRLMLDSCALYFHRNPYDGWFKRLDQIVSRTSYSLYGSGACHLDLIPYATEQKWTNLTSRQRDSLLAVAADALAILLSESQIRVLILNGKSVVRYFEEMTGATLREREMTRWALPRRNGDDVAGYSYSGLIDGLCGLSFSQSILVLGYNHNIQSSFGVTTDVIASIGSWIAGRVKDHISG